MENITIFADIIRLNISFVILGTSPKEYYSMEILDKTDLQILRVLQNNSRLTTKELAAKVNLSPTPVFERVKRLEANAVCPEIRPFCQAFLSVKTTIATRRWAIQN